MQQNVAKFAENNSRDRKVTKLLNLLGCVREENLLGTLPGRVHISNSIASLAVLWLCMLQQHVIKHSSHVDTHLVNKRERKVNQ